MRHSTRLIAAVIFAVTCVEGRTLAGLWTEDFEGGLDSRFHHQIAGYSVFGTWASVSPTHSLGLEPGTDYITFDLEESQFISYASVWFMYNGGPGTSVEFVGTLGSQSFRPLVGYPEWEFVDTTGLDLGHITEIRLSASQSIFDDISVNVVPEPTTALLLLFGAWMFRRKDGG
jgi:hypothetical protein